MAAELAVWLNDLHVATVRRDRKGRLRLAYTDTAHDAFEGGTPVLSLDLPLTRQSYPNARTRAFLDGLLPEGEPRRAIAAELDLLASDVFGLLEVLGRDCAGALVIQPLDDPPPRTPSTAIAEPLTDENLARLIAGLHSAPLGVDRAVRLSLAGVQEKLPLTRIPDGRWGRPIDGAPSTHILKPQISAYPQTVENEAFCMRVAANLGLEVANVTVISVAERPVLVVERYDRVVATDGTVRRVHQEDLCQALGLSPDRKYEENSGPTLARVARILLDAALDDAPDRFLQALTLNLALGNCDEHGKNFSLLHLESGALRLAPLYDLISTRFYPELDDKLAMFVNSVQKADRVTAERIINEAATWPMSRERAAAIVGDLLDRLPDAIAGAATQTPGVPEALVDLISARTELLMASR